MASREDQASGAAALAPFVVALPVLAALRPPGVEQLAASDPLVQALRAGLGAWGVPAIAAGVCAVAITAGRPGARALRRAAVLALAGALSALLVLGALAWLGHGRLPSFVPPEESPRPGLLLGLEAGVFEEALFRIVLLPALLALFGRRLSSGLAVLAAALSVGLLFAASHRLGPGAGVFRADLFATRTLVPGVAMSLLYVRVGPAFIITAHATAHLLIPFLLS